MRKIVTTIGVAAAIVAVPGTASARPGDATDWNGEQHAVTCPLEDRQSDDTCPPPGERRISTSEYGVDDPPPATEGEYGIAGIALFGLLALL